MENEDNIKKEMKIQYIVTETYTDEIDQMKNKCIRSILWTAEVALGKDSEDFINVRKSVLDNVNTLVRDINIILERDIFTKIGK